MRLIMLLGAAHGTVIAHDEGAGVPHTYRVAKGLGDATPYLPTDCEPVKFETLYYEYQLVGHDSREAYYVPAGFSKVDIIKGLLAAQ